MKRRKVGYVILVLASGIVLFGVYCMLYSTRLTTWMTTNPLIEGTFHLDGRTPAPPAPLNLHSLYVEVPGSVIKVDVNTTDTVWMEIYDEYKRVILSAYDFSSGEFSAYPGKGGWGAVTGKYTIQIWNNHDHSIKYSILCHLEYPSESIEYPFQLGGLLLLSASIPVFVLGAWYLTNKRNVLSASVACAR
jgi:hypothetical protein